MTSLLQGAPAIDGDDLAGDVVRLVRTEPDRESSDVVGLADNSTALGPAAGHPDRETRRVVLPPRVALYAVLGYPAYEPPLDAECRLMAG